MNDSARRGRKPSAEKRRALLAAARDAFGESGIEASTTRQIAARAGTTERTLFKHFASKDGLVQAVLESLVGELLHEGAFDRIGQGGAMAPDELAHWHRVFLEERVAAANEVPGKYGIVMRELLRDEAFRRRCVESWTSTVFLPLARQIKAMQAEGRLAAQPSAEALASAFFGLNLGYLLARFALAPENDWDSERDIAVIVDLFARMLAPSASH